MTSLVLTIFACLILGVNALYGSDQGSSETSRTSDAGSGTCGRESAELFSCKLNDLYRDIKELKDEMKMLKMKHKIDVKHLRTEHRVEIDDLKSEHEEEVGTLKEDHAKKIAKLEYDMRTLKEHNIKQVRGYTGNVCISYFGIHG